MTLLSPPTSPLFPYTTLFRSELVLSRELADRRVYPAIDLVASATRKEELLLSEEELAASHALRKTIAAIPTIQGMQDRKSTRLNSSHLGISYAVFCLKKKIRQ